MLLKIRKLENKKKKGVSLMIGYVLLVTLAIVMGIIAYNWMKTYLPRSTLECPDGVSILVKDANFNSSTSRLNLTLKNNGRFDINGYFIYAKNSSTQDLAAIDLSSYLDKSFGGNSAGNSILFFSQEVSGLKTTLSPGDQTTHIFNIPQGLGQIYSVNIVPTRLENENNKEKFVSCGSSGEKQLIGESAQGQQAQCTPESVSATCGTWTCGNKINNCGSSVSCPPGCTGTNVCDSSGACIPPAQCTDTCATFGYTCGTHTICGVSTICGSNGGACGSGSECSAAGQCVLLCGNRVINAGEQCDDGNTANSDGCSSTCVVEGGWSCTGQPSICLQGGAGGSFNSCGDYCNTFQGYTAVFACVQNPNQCGSSRQYIGNIPDANATYGNSLCGTNTNADTCCCTPG